MPSSVETSGPDPNSGVLVRTGRNFGWLAGSAGFSAVASILYVALTARTLGPAAFGAFALIMTYGELLANLSQFQSWKALTSFGAALQMAGERARLGRLFAYAASADALGAIGGTLLGLVGVRLIGPWLHWTIADENAAAWFGTALLLTSSTAPAGMLRLLNRFDLQVLSEAVAQITRLIGCIAGWLVGAGVGWFLCIWALAALLQLAAQWTAVLALRHGPSLRPSAVRLAHHENRDLWRFLLKTNFSSSLNLLWMYCGTLVVGIRAGPVEAGGFRLAHRFSLAIMKPVEIAAKALSPELARLLATGDQSTMRRVLIKVSGISAAFGSVVVLAAALYGGDILRLVAGPRFEFAQQFFALLSIAAAINLVGFALEPFHNAHFRPGSVLRANLVATLVYGVVLIIFLPRFGAKAAAFAAIAASVAIFIQLAWSALGILASMRRAGLSAAPDERSHPRPELHRPVSVGHGPGDQRLIEPLRESGK